MPDVTKLLIANRGEIASRVIRTARAMGIASVAVFSDADETAPFVGEADEAVRLPGSSPADTYLRAEAIVAAARRTGADAVHPGYGFLSENAAFARACEAAGLVFVGPSPRAIETMGSKIEAKRLMADAGVPVLPGVTVAAGATPEELRSQAESVGYPLMVKASFGGGGRGMRVVGDETDLLASVEGAQREAASAFGDGTVFLERFVSAPRHVEVQVFGDHHGNVVHLFERECSIQRRHQKIIEEAPSPAVDDKLRADICAAAIAAARAIGYVGAGTVEFVLAPDGHFYFLEVNTRLQVEHPVTEMVTGLDLVEVQLLVARGEPLPPEVLAARIHGHAIEARLYAEDVHAGFLPTSGVLHRIAVPERPGLRVDAGYADGSIVTTHYDAMLAKVVAWAPNRPAAAASLADALDRAQLHGVTTNRSLLVGTLRHAEFLAGRTDTAFYERHDPVLLAAEPVGDEAIGLHAVAAALAGRGRRSAPSPLPAGVPAGWRNAGTDGQTLSFACDGRTVSVAYRPERGRLAVSVDGVDLGDVRVWHAGAEMVDVEIAGVRRQVAVQRAGDTYYLDSPLGHSALVEAERFPVPVAAVAAGSLLAPMPGSVVGLAVRLGDPVTAGDVLVTLEAMKMEHVIRSPHDGTVAEVLVAVGDQVDTGSVLLVVDAGGEGTPSAQGAE